MNHLVNAMLRTLDKVPTVNRKLASLCAEYLSIHENFDYNQDSNGERWLLQTLARNNRLSLCFDIGANHGDWTGMVLTENPRANIHCFEISPITYKKTSERFGSDSRVVLNSFGLSNEAGDITLKHCHDGDGMSSIVEVVLSSNVEPLAVKVIRGADYCANNKIAKIDMMKIDVEGAENLVLEGFGECLTPQNVPVIQFEYGMVNIASKFLLRDFHRLFESRGYRVGKLFPRYVRFREYRFQDEDFRGPNYIAASPDVAKLLS
jgi:FkbM family methyltransferase